jgi:hypothetical protein
LELDPSSSLQSHGRRPAVEKTEPLFVGSWEEKPNQKGLALQEHVTPLYEEAGQWVVEGSELDGFGSLITSLLSDYRRQSFLRPTLGRVVDGSTGGAGLYPHGCGLYLEKSLFVRWHCRGL